MKRRFWVILIVLSALDNFNGIAQAPPVFDWQKCLGGSGLDIPNKIIRSNDGGYIIAGSTTSANRDITYNHGVRDIWVVKTNSAGTIQWQKTFGGTGSEFSSAVFQLSNDDIVVSGYTSSTNGNVTVTHGSLDQWLLRLNSSGSLIWQKTFGGSSLDICNSMDLCADGGFILGGSSSSNNGNVSGNHGNKDFWIVKTDSMGNLQWQKSLGGSNAEECYKIKATSDGGYIASGYTSSTDGQVSGSHGGNDYWVVKLDNNGDLQWQKCLGGSSNEVATTALQNASGNFVIGGYSNSNDDDITDPRGSSDFWVAWLDSSDGSLLSQHSYGGSYSDVAYDLIGTADGGYILAGGSTSNDFDVTGNHGGEDFWLTKTDASGNIAWARSYGGPGNDRPSSIIQNDDGGFSATGYTYSNNMDVSGNHGTADIWLMTLSCLTPSSDFSTRTNVVCVNSMMNFTNNSVHAAVSEWQVNDVAFSQNTNPSFQFNAAGTYKISLISSTCYESDTLNQYFTVYDYPVPSITSSQSYLCDGNSATLETITADSYLWSNGESTASITVDSGAVYSVTVTTNGCSSSTAYAIDQYPYPGVDLGIDTAICSGSSITLHAQPGYQNYLWQDGSSDSLFTVNGAGSFFVIVSNGFCSSTDAIQVSTISNPVPSVTADVPYLCQGNSATLSVTSADDFLWDDGETTSSIVVNSGGMYSVTVTTNGCSGATSFTVDQYSNPTIELGNDTMICPGSVIMLRAQPGYQSYLWQDGSVDSTFTASSAGSYYVTVNNGYCSSTDSIHINAATCAVLAANFAATQTTICQNSCIDFSDMSQNAVSWDWFFPGAVTASSNLQNPLNICYNNPGTYPVSLIVHGSTGTSNGVMRMSYITVDPAPALPTISANGTFLTSSYANSYQWLLNSVPVNGATSQTFDAIQSGYYSVRIAGTGGCTAISDSVYIGFTGIDKPAQHPDIYVYPNPAKGIFYLFFIKSSTEKTEVDVTDLTGKTIFHSILDPMDKLSIETINLEEFSNGVYLLHLKTDSKILNKKLVIQR